MEINPIRWAEFIAGPMSLPCYKAHFFELMAMSCSEKPVEVHYSNGEEALYSPPEYGNNHDLDVLSTDELNAYWCSFFDLDDITGDDQLHTDTDEDVKKEFVELFIRSADHSLTKEGIRVEKMAYCQSNVESLIQPESRVFYSKHVKTAYGRNILRFPFRSGAFKGVRVMHHPLPNNVFNLYSLQKELNFRQKYYYGYDRDGRKNIKKTAHLFDNPLRRRENPSSKAYRKISRMSGLLDTYRRYRHKIAHEPQYRLNKLPISKTVVASEHGRLAYSRHPMKKMSVENYGLALLNVPQLNQNGLISSKNQRSSNEVCKKLFSSVLKMQNKKSEVEHEYIGSKVINFKWTYDMECEFSEKRMLDAAHKYRWACFFIGYYMKNK